MSSRWRRSLPFHPSKHSPLIAPALRKTFTTKYTVYTYKCINRCKALFRKYVYKYTLGTILMRVNRHQLKVTICKWVTTCSDCDVHFHEKCKTKKITLGVLKPFVGVAGWGPLFRTNSKYKQFFWTPFLHDTMTFLHTRYLEISYVYTSSNLSYSNMSFFGNNFYAGTLFWKRHSPRLKAVSLTS